MGALDFCEATGKRLTGVACCRCLGCELSILAKFPAALLKAELKWRDAHSDEGVDDLSAVDQLVLVGDPRREARLILAHALARVRKLGLRVTTELSSHCHNVETARDFRLVPLR